MNHTSLPLPLWQLARRPLGAFFFAFMLAASFVTMVLAACQGCGGSPTTPRARARATVMVLAGAIESGRKACNDAVLAREGAGSVDSALSLGQTCLASYTTAYSSLLAAGGAIDAWDEGRANDTTCATVRGAEAAKQLAAAIRSGGGSVPKALDDGLELYTTIMASSCADGGAS